MTEKYLYWKQKKRMSWLRILAKTFWTFSWTHDCINLILRQDILECLNLFVNEIMKYDWCKRWKFRGYFPIEPFFFLSFVRSPLSGSRSWRLAKLIPAAKNTRIIATRAPLQNPKYPPFDVYIRRKTTLSRHKLYVMRKKDQLTKKLKLLSKEKHSELKGYFSLEHICYRLTAFRNEVSDTGYSRMQAPFFLGLFFIFWRYFHFYVAYDYDFFTVAKPWVRRRF